MTCAVLFHQASAHTNHRPNHVITFLRKEHLPLNEAAFQVPLRFTKFDLRDYLWNVYGVEVKKVRSFVKQVPLVRRNAMSNSWYRPQPQKIMNVELAQPFQWPEVPEDKSDFFNNLFTKREEASERREEQPLVYARKRGARERTPIEKEQRDSLAKLAKQMLSGEVKWSNDVTLDPKWDKLLEDQGIKQGINERAVQTRAPVQGESNKSSRSFEFCRRHY